MPLSPSTREAKPVRSEFEARLTAKVIKKPHLEKQNKNRNSSSRRGRNTWHREAQSVYETKNHQQLTRVI